MDTVWPRNIRYLRCKVWICLEAPLISGFFLTFLVGSHQWIECQYERICRMCRKCGKIGHTDGQCAMSFQEGQTFIDNHLAQVAQQLGTWVIQQGDQRLYTSRIRVTAHRPERRSTRLHHRTTWTPIRVC